MYTYTNISEEWGREKMESATITIAIQQHLLTGILLCEYNF